MRHLSRQTVDGVEYAVTTDTGGYYLHQTDADAQFAGTVMDIDPAALPSVIAGLTEALRLFEAQEAVVRGLVG